MSTLVCGIFVGGAGSRMGGIAKGLLPTAAGGPSVVERLVAELRAAAHEPRIALVGSRPEYAALGIETIADATTGAGPIAGLEALLTNAVEGGANTALALACDLPYVGARLLRRILTESPNSAALAPKPEGRWQPLCARYSAAPALRCVKNLRAQGEHALFRVLQELDATELTLGPHEVRQLDDWDEPGDVRAR